MFIPGLFNALLLPEIILKKYAKTEMQQFVKVLLVKKKKNWIGATYVPETV